MKTLLKLFLVGAGAFLLVQDEATADVWARVDRQWSRAELDQAIAYCRIQPRVNNDIRLLVDLVHGQEINKCMQALGWLGVAR